MDWESAKQKLLNNIEKGSKIDPNSAIREVLVSPSSSFDGYKVKTSVKGTFVTITIEMLQDVFIKTKENKNIYNRSVIYDLCRKQVETHSCYVHVVGHIFTYAGVMKKVDKRNFQLLKE